jgi:hypothetical protein
MTGPDEAPVWLSEEREIQALLEEAVNRFDRLPAEERERDVLLPAERFLSSLQRADDGADQLWSLVGDLERRGVLRIRRGRTGPFDPPWKGAKLAFAEVGENALRNWLQRERTPGDLERWRAVANANAHLFPGDFMALWSRRITIEDRSPEEVISAFARIGQVRGPITLRQLSAQCFWGDSKILDQRAELIAALFPRLVVRDRAIVVAVHLPLCWEGVLFIENQDTYTAACGGTPSEVASLALVYASGFRSSAERVRSFAGAILHFAGPGTRSGETDSVARFERWWFEQEQASPLCWFWGDLDFAGMQILKTLRARFGEVSSWRPGYAPMLAQLRKERGYSPAVESGKGQSDPLTTGCVYADKVLLPAIRERGQLDQEMPFG